MSIAHESLVVTGAEELVVWLVLDEGAGRSRASHCFEEAPAVLRRFAQPSCVTKFVFSKVASW